MNPLFTLFLAYLAASALPPLVAHVRGLPERVQMNCWIGALLTGWTLIGWAFFMLMALCETPSVSIRTTISISSPVNPR